MGVSKLMDLLVDSREIIRNDVSCFLITNVLCSFYNFLVISKNYITCSTAAAAAAAITINFFFKLTSFSGDYSTVDEVFQKFPKEETFSGLLVYDC